MNSSQDFNLSKLLNPIYRRKDMVVAVFLVVVALAAYLAVSLPDVYRSSTLILITPQKLPANYVASTVTTSIDQRILAMTQQILSRTSLESVIRESNLYSTDGSLDSIEQRVESLRKRIKTEVTTRNDTFKLSFEAESPEKAMQVTARLASLFIGENIRVREQQASGTTSFINVEVDRLRKELEEQESIVNLYKMRHQTDLPEQLDANVRSLEQMRRELESGMFRLTSLEERKATLDRQAIEAERLASSAAGEDKSGTARAILSKAGIDARKRELELLRSRYSDKHPDVVRLKDEIATIPLEEKSAAADARAIKTGGQTDVLTSEITLLRERGKKLQSEIAGYQERINNTPIRAIELSKITRNYDITLKKFQELLSKGFDSQLSENMERTQRGEQFQVVDPPAMSQNPVAPNRLQIFLVGLALGLAAAFGAAFLIENLDTSIKGNDDLEAYSDLPLLAVLPVVPCRANILELRQARTMLLLCSAGVLALGLFLIRLFGPMLPLR
jgi:polysaccharide chain length determinant protein (PEP-CTERM system associated)